MLSESYTIGRWVALIAAMYTGSFCSGGNVERFSTEPSDTVAARGQIVVLRCAVDNRVGQVQWLRDGFGLGIGPTFDGFPRYRVDESQTGGVYNLVISNVQLEDDASFQCQVGATESTSGLRSRITTLTVHVPPSGATIDGSPTIEAIAEVDSQLVCHATGARPAATITWLRDGAKVTAAETLATPGEGKLMNSVSRLTIRPTLADQGATYTCQATNEAALRQVTADVKLNVLYAPTVAMVATPAEGIREFDRVVFTCSATSNPDVDEWRWFKDDDNFADEGKDTLVIDRIDRSFHGKSISCEAKNKVGKSKQSTTVNMKYGPKFLTEISELTADNGAKEVSMSCEVGSNPSARYVWTRDGARFPVLSRSPTLTISSLTEEKFGLYTCTVAVEGYQPISRAVQLLMNGPSQIVSPQDQSARYGDTATVECSVLGVPQPNYITWTRDGRPLDFHKLDRYKVAERSVRHGRVSVLVINSVQDSDFGAFNCTTDNGYGFVYKEITLSKKVVVPLQYILTASVAGLILVIVICVAVFVYRRRRSIDSEVGSDSSECRMTTRGNKDNFPAQDTKGDYSLKNEEHGELMDSFPGDNYVDGWKTDRFSGRYHVATPTSRDLYSPYDSWNRRSPYHPQSPSLCNERTSTLPPSVGYYDVGAIRRPGSIDDFRGNVYWPDAYGTMRPRVLPSRREVTTPYDFRPIVVSPSPVPVDLNQLATNV